MSEMVRFPMNGVSGSGYLAVPASGTGPGVVVIQEWWGLVDHIKTVADRLAAVGFVALAPGLLRRADDEQSGRSGQAHDGAQHR